MLYRVVLTRRVRSWVELQAEALAERNPSAAQRFRERMATAWRLLADHPRAGRPGLVSGTRRLVILPYVITYREAAASIVILDIRHGRQAEVLLPDEG